MGKGRSYLIKKKKNYTRIPPQMQDARGGDKNKAMTLYNQKTGMHAIRAPKLFLWWKKEI